MQCSICDSKLSIYQVNDTAFNLCAKCNGMWIGENEISKTLDCLLENPLPVPINLSNIEQSKPDSGFCPKCSQIVKQVKIYRQDFQLLKCINCSGIWISINDLPKILKWWKKNRRGFGIHYFSPKKEYKFLDEGDTAMAYAGLMEDVNPLNKMPFFTILLILLNIVGLFVWIPTEITDNLRFMFIPSLFLTSPGKQWPTLFSSMFMHVSYAHIAGNMIYLYVFGNNIEDRIGWIKFILLYLFFGISASVIYSFIFPDQTMPMLGASGAVSGILGAYLLLYPKAQIRMHKTAMGVPYSANVPAYVFLGIYFIGLQLIGIAGNIPGIAWHIHLIGFAEGYGIMYLMRRFDLL